jgi:hypothetical protein
MLGCFGILAFLPLAKFSTVLVSIYGYKMTENLIEEFKTAFYNCQHGELLSIHLKIQAAIEETPKLRRKFDFMEYNRFRSEEEYIDDCFALLNSPNWVLVSESNGIKIESQGGGNNFFTRSSVDIPVSMFEVLSVISEADLAPSWVDALKGCEILASPTMTRKLVKYHFWFPWPVSDRHCIVEFNALPLPDRHACMVTMKTPSSENYMNMKIPALNEGETRMWVRTGCLYIEYIDPVRTRVTYVVTCDLNIALLPMVLINFGTKHIMYYVMDKLREKVLGFNGSIYEQRVREKPEFYDFLRKSIFENLRL